MINMTNGLIEDLRRAADAFNSTYGFVKYDDEIQPYQPQTTSIMDENGEKQTGVVDQPTYNDEWLAQHAPGAWSSIQNLKQKYSDAMAVGDNEAARLAHETANKIRNSYGYTADESGNWAGLLLGFSGPGGGVGGDDNRNREPGLGGGTYLDGLMSALQEQYRQALASNDAITAASVQQAINQLNAQKQQLGQQYDQLAKQLYIDRRMGEKNLPQQMAALGYTGGLTESSMLGLATNYQQALASNERTRLQGYNNIEQQIADAQLTGEIARAQNAQQIGQNYFSNYASVVQAMQNQANADRQYGFQQQQFGYEKQQDALAYQYQMQQDAFIKVQQLMAMGITPTAEQLAAAGIVLPEETGNLKTDYIPNPNPVPDPEVTAQQEFLNAVGYRVRIDGIMGPETQQALADYRAKMAAEEVGPNGRTDEDIGADAYAYYAGAPNASEDVIRSMLKLKGYTGMEIQTFLEFYNHYKIYGGGG
jgi:hypothetical protein